MSIQAPPDDYLVKVVKHSLLEDTVMKYLCLIYDAETSYANMSKAESDAFMGEYFAFTEGIKKSGHYLGGEALQPVHTATTVRVRNGKTSTTDGPFAETKEQLGGYYMIERQGSERRHSDCGEDSLGQDRQRRSAADPGFQPTVEQWAIQTSRRGRWSMPSTAPTRGACWRR